MIKCILACTKCGGIGKDGGLPWPRNPVDLSLFKQYTSDAVVIVGRKTADTLPELKGRTVVVVSRDGLSLTDALAQYPDCVIIGGGEIYEQVFEQGLAQEVLVHTIEGEYEVDTVVNMRALHTHYVVTMRAPTGVGRVTTWERR